MPQPHPNAPRHWRIGMIVPSSNTTMETEIPELLRRQTALGRDAFSFHSARLRLRQVTPEALQAMNAGAVDAVDALCDAQVDALMYACLVATMAGGRSSVAATEVRLLERAMAADTRGERSPALVSSGGALVAALREVGAQRISLIAPYREELTARVVGTLAEYGIETVQTRSLGVVDNAAVARLSTAGLLRMASALDCSTSDALVISACVQMPSLDVLEEAEQKLGLPVISAATASAWSVLVGLDIEPAIAHAGWLLRRTPRHAMREMAVAS